MKKTALIVILALMLIGCEAKNHPVSSQNSPGPGLDFPTEEYIAVFSFPEPTVQIKVTRSSQDKETEFVIGPDVFEIGDQSCLPIITWFYGLELTECKKAPKIKKKNVYYDFKLYKKEEGFGYYEVGEKAFVFVGEKCYTVGNPSTPPLE